MVLATFAIAFISHGFVCDLSLLQAAETPTTRPATGPADRSSARAEVKRLMERCKSGDGFRLMQIARLAASCGAREECLKAAQLAEDAGMAPSDIDVHLSALAKQDVEELKSSVLSVRLQTLLQGANSKPDVLQRYTRIALLQAEPATLRRELEFAIVSKNSATRKLAAELWNHANPAGTSDALVRRIQQDRIPEVRQASAGALAHRNDIKAVVSLANGVHAQTPLVRVHCAEALGEMREVRAAETLLTRWYMLMQAGSTPEGRSANIFCGTQVAYVGGYNVEVAQAAAIAEPVISTLMTGAVLDVRVLAVSVERQIAFEKNVVHDALVKIAGRDYGNSPSDWAAFLKATKTDPQTGRAEPPVSTSTASGKPN